MAGEGCTGGSADGREVFLGNLMDFKALHFEKYKPQMSVLLTLSVNIITAGVTTPDPGVCAASGGFNMEITNCI